MNKKTLLTLIALCAAVAGLVCVQFIGAATYTQPLYGSYDLVPTADSTDNVVMRDVVGNKTDAAATGAVSTTESLMAYMKQTVTGQNTIDAFFDVPTADVATNTTVRDVVGNKTDAAVGTVTTDKSLMGYIKGILTDTGTTIPGTITTAQADLDIITGATGVNLLTATQASIDAIETDTGTTLPGLIATAQADLDILTGATGANLLTATQASIDAIEVDTSTTIPGTITTLQGNVTDILADTAVMQPVQEMAVSKTLTTIASGNNDLFVVAGGPIKILEIVAYVATEIEGKSCLINYNFDPTTPATDTAFATTGTALEINGDAVGTLYTWDGVVANNLIATTNGVALGLPTYSGIIVPAGSLELAADVVTSATGAITFYLRYIPLSTASTVTAAS